MEEETSLTLHGMKIIVDKSLPFGVVTFRQKDGKEVTVNIKNLPEDEEVKDEDRKLAYQQDEDALRRKGE